MVLGMDGSLGVGISLLIGLALLKYSGYADTVKKELSWIASGAVFLLLSSVVGVATDLGALSTIVGVVQSILLVIAFILVLIGAIFMTVQLIAKIR